MSKKYKYELPLDFTDKVISKIEHKEHVRDTCLVILYSCIGLFSVSLILAGLLYFNILEINLEILKKYLPIDFNWIAPEYLIRKMATIKEAVIHLRWLIIVMIYFLILYFIKPSPQTPKSSSQKHPLNVN